MNFLKKLLIGKKFLQPVYEKLFRISLRGMNYGLGGMTGQSGEVNVIRDLNKKFKNQNIVIFDIGANNGQYTKLLIDNINTSKRSIYSFEPSKLGFEKLKKMEDGKSVFAWNLALSDKKGESELFYDSPGTAWASMSPINYSQYDKKLDKAEKISTITLDEFCSTESINNINFCKIDVEGHELSVLKGAKSLLENDKIDIIQFEFGLASSYSGIYLRDFFSVLNNYKIYRIVQDGIYPIEYNERYEIFLTTNYLAINKTLINKA